MRFGFYEKLAWSNIRKNRRIYLPYMATTTGIVTMFYILTHLGMDKEVESFTSGLTLQLILRLGIIVVGIFSVIFLFYINSFLMKRRKTELGLYNVLGMGKLHIARVLFWETFYSGGLSIVLGVACGVLLSKVGQLGLFKIINIQASYSFQVYSSVVVITVGFFAALQALLYINSVRQIVKSSARELLSSDAAGEKEPKANFLIALVGLIFLGAGYVLAIKISDPMAAIGMFFIAVILVILGTYCCFIAGSVALFKLLRKNKNYYYKTNHFISVSSMIYRMKRNGAGLASICILSTMVLVMLSATSCMYLGGDDALEKAYPRDMEISSGATNIDAVTYDETVKYIDQKVEEAATKAGTSVENRIRCRSCSFYVKFEGNRIDPADEQVSGETMAVIEVLPLEDFNISNHVQKTLRADEVLAYSEEFDMREGELQIMNMSYQTVDVLENMTVRLGNVMGVKHIYLVVRDMQEVRKIYDKVHEAANKDGQEKNYYIRMGYYLGFDTDLKEEQQGELRMELSAMGETEALTGWYDKKGHEPVFDSLYINASSGMEARKDFYGMYGGFFFLGILLSLTFIMATVLIMYYKQITEGYEDQNRFQILKNVGMTQREIKKTINSQVLTVFFAPLLMAGLHIAFAFHMIALMLSVFAITNTTLLVELTVAGFLLFALFYVAVYLITSKTYYRLVSIHR